MLAKRLKILLSMIAALFMVQTYMYLTDNPGFIPAQTAGVKQTVANFKAPDFSALMDSITFKFGSVDNDLAQRDNSFSLPSVGKVTKVEPTEIPVVEYEQELLPEEIYEAPSPTKRPVIPTPVKKAVATPTKKPKPTKVPKATPTPRPDPITSDTRPGSSLSEIFEEVGRRACFPAALLLAFQQEESGAFFSANSSPSIVKIYNTYGWWQTGAGDPCFGLGYHTQTGIVPSDSVGAGTQCRNSVGNPTDIGIMGILQISEEEENLTRKYTKETLPKNIDRRVLFDNALIFAIATKNRVGSVPKNCDDWPDDAVMTAAEKHQGVCVADYGNGNTRNYCKDILQMYKKFK